MGENILYEKKDGVARITLNRPQALNALTPALLSELKEALNRVAADPEIGVVVLKGAGRAFSAGVDIKGIDEGTDAGVGPRKHLALEVIEAIEKLDRPVIAQVHGYCLTGALELAMVCDLILAAESARLGDTHARWGMTPTWGASQRLPRLVGPHKAKELAFTCDMISAREAERIGLINRAVPDDKLEEAVQEMADKILANSRASVAIQKSLINRGLRTDLAAGLMMAEVESPGRTPDSEERVKSFIDKTWDKSKARPAS